jgi:hypothetical protein
MAPDLSRARWYVRHAGAESGPFPTGQVRDYLLLGRFAVSDPVSRDRVEWIAAEDVVGLLPEALVHHGRGLDEAQVIHARLRADERSGLERRQDEVCTAETAGDRRRADRRRPEPEAFELARHTRVAALHRRRGMPNVYVLGAGLIGAVSLAVVLVATLSGGTETQAPNCAAPAASGVNWNGCALLGLKANGADLSQASMREARLSGASLRRARLVDSDLSYADLSGANLARADLRRAKLVGTNLSGANLASASFGAADLTAADMRGANIAGATFRDGTLDRAIWIDGSSCARGSVGKCRAANSK